ncbi:MAG: extracellular solute-binding protein [Oscillospiraceae bacterium]|nr:extracellular solute-binding protein [Oscillospiraceae bacterium]
MNRKIFSLLLCIVMGLVFLAGCHGSVERPSFSLPERFDTSGTFTITFWAKNDTNKVQTAIYEKAIRDFQEIYPNITVNLRLYTDYSRIYNDVITNIATNTTPNVCITYPDHIATYLTGNDVVVPLDELLTDTRYGLGGSEVRFDAPTKDEVVPEFLQECRINGVCYALPYMRSTEACYVNKTAVEALGYELPEILTWDFVWEVSEAAMARDSGGTFLLNGQKVLIPFIYKSTDNMMIQMLRQLDAPYSDGNGKIGIFSDVTRDVLLTIASHAKTGAFSTFKISSYPANFLNAGQCIFAVDSTAGATWMGSDAPLLDISADKLVQFETAVLPVPQFDTAHPKMISQGPSVCIFNKADPQEVLASWLFAQYLLTDEVQIAYAKTEGYVPVTQKAQQNTLYQEYLAHAGEDNQEHYSVKLQASQLLMDHTEDTFVTPVFNGSASLRDAAGQMIENVTKSVRRKENVDDAYIQKLYSDVTSLYRLNVEGSESSSSSRQELGPLPATARTLLISLAFAWILIAVAFFVLRRQKR